MTRSSERRLGAYMTRPHYRGKTACCGRTVVTAKRLHPVVRYTPETFTPVVVADLHEYRCTPNITTMGDKCKTRDKNKHVIKVFKNKIRLNKKEVNLVQVLSLFFKEVLIISIIVNLNVIFHFRFDANLCLNKLCVRYKTS